MGPNKRGKPKRFSRGWKVARWGSAEKKEDPHPPGPSGSLHKTDHVSRTAREDRTTEEAPSGSGEEDQTARLSAHREAWAPRGKSLVTPSTNRIKRTGPSIEHRGTPRPMRKERLREPPTWTPAPRSERKERTQRTKQGAREKEQSVRPSQKPWRSQQKPKWFGLEVFSFGSRPRLIETELEPGQGVTLDQRH